MFSYIKGELIESNADYIVVETGGVGFEIQISGMDYNELPVCGSEVKIHTYFSVREDSMTLFGFLSKDSKALFELLITVSGIGPKGALSILSVLSPDDLRFAILSQDAKAIAKAPGIGSKTAQRVILDLKDKISLEDAFDKKLENASKNESGSGNSARKDEAVEALISLGYSSSESFKAVSKVNIDDNTSVEDILSQALIILATL